jgi:hypothetical protein
MCAVGRGEWVGILRTRVSCEAIVLFHCLISFILCRRSLQVLLKIRPSSLLMLCGCISS